MKIATFNINNINRRLPNLLRWLRAAKPDIVCLQELKSTDADFPVAAIEKAGYGAVWRGQKTWNGVAILARKAEPVLIRNALARRSRRSRGALHRSRRQRHPDRLPLSAERQSAARTEIRLPSSNGSSGCSGMPRNFSSRTFRSCWPAITTSRPTAADIYPTRSWDKDALIQPQSRAAFPRWAQGWTDAIRTLHPSKPMFTFWDYKRNRWPRDAGLRLDHLLLSPALAPRLIKAGVDREVRGEDGASDHAPAWIVLLRCDRKPPVFAATCSR